MDERVRHTVALADLRRERNQAPAPARPSALGVSLEEWEEAWLAVLAFVLRMTKSLSLADDIRQEAFLRLLTSRRWTKESGEPFVRHMLLAASSILKHAKKARHRRDRYETAGGTEYARERGTAAASPEQDVLEHDERVQSQDRAARVIEELRRRLARHPLELRLIDHAEKVEARGGEVEKPAEIAQILGVHVKQMYRALARIRRYKQSVRAAVDEQLRSAGDGKAKP